ncbi:hypothetical protein BDW60DRAFT_223559 [Aspergillus nidulans var. acristatus]
MAAQLNAPDDPTTLGHCVHKLFERAADRYADKTALCCATKELSYRDLNARANRLARLLARRGITRGDLVVVALDRSLDLVSALLAVLKTGAAYVPMDPSFPLERIRHMMEDAQPKLIVTCDTVRDALSSWKELFVNVDAAHDTSNADIGNLQADVQTDDLAYVIYTSGSTGKPKGVEVSHGAVSNLLWSMRQDPGCEDSDRLLAVTTVSFDIAVLELFLPLICGATTVIAQEHEVADAGALLRLIECHRVGIMQGTPATWQILLDSGWCGTPRLDKILCGGEALSRRLADRLLYCADAVWNMYGPTEATVWASIWRVRYGDSIIVGSPIANTQLYVLDTDLSPVPLGSAGELYIGGAGVARGYHSNPKLTRSRFLQNPFRPGIIYRTGDVARFNAPGKLSVLGRTDDQVKIRGYRIEPGDIEAAITDHDSISRAVVISRDDRLIAYCAGEAPKPDLGRLLRPWLAERLPTYMVPAFFVELDEFPLTLNGKIDRKALPDPLARVEVVAKPATELERHILATWSDVLGHDRIDINDNFFEIGGDSLRVVRVQMELEKLLQRSVLPAKLFEHYTIKALAAYLAEPGQINAEPRPVRPPVQQTEGIAIISMACRLPGGITTPDQYWELLDKSVDAITDVPKGRWDADALYDADPQARGKSYCRRGGFIDTVDAFDAAFFGISPREARSLDPMQCMMLETCWEAFERAGYTTKQLRGSQTGAYIGISSIPAYLNHPHPAKCLDDLDGYAGTGSAGATMSGRVSYVLGLEGPALTVDTACSSSLVATHLACTALRQGECDLAVAGGVSLLLSPGVHVEFSRLQGMAPNGQCRPFSADAQGTVWGEGAAAIVLKRLSDAQRDNDPILAVLPSTAVNHGGRSASLTTPSGPAQKRLIHMALAASRLQPSDIDYVEAHGTGTKLGDPIEGSALAEVFGDQDRTEPLWIGSAKSNVGHTQAAAGLVGLLKVVLAMQHSMLPQTLHVKEPMPAVDWTSANMMPVQAKRPWRPQKHRLRRAGVSAFGISGTNAHAIVEEPPQQPAAQQHPSALLPRALPFLLSATTDAALRQQAERLHSHLSSNNDRLSDVSYSLAVSRNHFQHRLVLFAQDKRQLMDKLAGSTRIGWPAPSVHDNSPRLALLFTGQGSQRPGMGRDLARHYPVFREALEEIAGHFIELEPPLLEVMWANAGSNRAALLQRTDYAQPALFAFEMAVWRLWASWGLVPELLLGHSIGELVAAHVAGVMPLSDACRLVAARGRLMQALQSQGRMMSLEASAVETAEAIEILGLSNEVAIAAHNTPTQTVASGNVNAVETLRGHFAAQGRRCKTLNVSQAFHSHHMDGMLADFQAIAETVRFQAPTIPIISGLTGQLAAPGQMEQPGYWTHQVRHAVRYSDGIQTLVGQGITIALELGPQPVLSSMGAASLASKTTAADDVHSVAWLPSVDATKDETSTIQSSLAELHLRHVSINWDAFFAPFGCQRVQLPTYAFQRQLIQPEPQSPPWKIISTSTTSQDGPLIDQLTEQPGRTGDLRHALTVTGEPYPSSLNASILPVQSTISSLEAPSPTAGPWQMKSTVLIMPAAIVPVRHPRSATCSPSSVPRTHPISTTRYVLSSA